jgi:pyruvate/2-oxoglutarate dehydrogenase complex dihydrolipoamide dehydrogenase (E3) component
VQSGALSFAAGTVQMGASVVLLERHKMGRDCLNYVCIPSKAFIAAAIAPNDSIEHFTQLGIEIILDAGKFLDKTIIATEPYLVKAKRFIIATGSSPFIPPIKGLFNLPFDTNGSIFNLTQLPSHLVIIGTGPISIEMAQAFRRLGSKITVLEACTALLKEALTLSATLKTMLSHEDNELQKNITINNIEQPATAIKVNYTNAAQKTITTTASHLLVATGHPPNLQPLNLAAASIFSTQGIKVQFNLRTSNPKVYAIGDYTGGYQLAHVAGYHTGLAIRNSIFRLDKKMEIHAIPWVTYAQVGFIEAQLKYQAKTYHVLSIDFSDNDCAQIERQTQGTIKVLTCPKGYVLGVSILGSQAGELIYSWIIAIQPQLKLSQLASSIAPYPGRGDLTQRIAGSFYTKKIFSAWMKCGSKS